MDSELFKLFMQGESHELGEYQKALEVYSNALADWKKQKLKSIFTKSYQAEVLGIKWKQIKEHEEKLNCTIRETKAQKHNNLYLWLTVSPKPSIEFDDFKSRVEKAVTRTMFSDYLYVYEQRGTEQTADIGEGFHAHILLKRNLDYKPCKVITNIKNTFKDMTIVDNKEIFAWYWCSNEYKLDKVEYITGLKTAEGKDEKQIGDKLWRKYNDLETFYGNLEI